MHSRFVVVQGFDVAAQEGCEGSRSAGSAIQLCLEEMPGAVSEAENVLVAGLDVVDEVDSDVVVVVEAVKTRVWHQNHVNELAIGSGRSAVASPSLVRTSRGYSGGCRRRRSCRRRGSGEGRRYTRRRQRSALVARRIRSTTAQRRHVLVVVVAGADVLEVLVEAVVAISKKRVNQKCGFKGANQVALQLLHVLVVVVDGADVVVVVTEVVVVAA